MTSIKYFELHPIYGNSKPFKVSFEDRISSTRKKVPSVVNKSISINWATGKTLNHAIGMKADIPMNTSLIDKDLSKNYAFWSDFNSYKYCIIQLSRYGTIDLIAVNDIQGMCDLSLEDKHKSKVVTTAGEISLYDLCLNMKIFSSDIPNSYGVEATSEIFDGVYVTVGKNTMYFIKYKKNRSYREPLGATFSYLNYVSVAKLLGVDSL